MVERNPGVIVATGREGRKRHDGTGRWRELKDLIALCNENVARGEAGSRRHEWSHSHVSFQALPRGEARNRRDRRGNPRAVEREELRVAELGYEQAIRLTGHAYRPGAEGPDQEAKEHMVGGVNHS